MRIPDSVKIGPYTIPVIAHEGELRGDNDRQLAGRIDYNNLDIRIVTDIHEQRRREVFWHECLHGIDFFMDTDLTEAQIQRLAAGLYAFLLDNHLLKDD